MRIAIADGSPDCSAMANATAARPAHTAGTSFCDLAAEDLNDAILVAGQGGTFTLHPEQLAQLGACIPSLAMSIAGIAPARVVASEDVETIDNGANWLGRYVGERATVGIVSRRAVVAA